MAVAAVAAILHLCLFATSCPRVNAFHNNIIVTPPLFYPRVCMIGNGERKRVTGLNNRALLPRCKCTQLKMASPMIEEDLKGNAPPADDDCGQYPTRETNTSPSSKDPIEPDTVSFTTKGSTSSRRRRQLPTNWLGEKNYILFTAVLIGLFTGINIALFKTAVEFVREVLYGDGINLQLVSPYLWNSGREEIRTLSLRLSEVLPISVIPAVGGLIVGLLLRFGGDMPPGLRDAVREGMIECFIPD